MQVKRYEATSVHEAMVNVKADFGPEARLLSSNLIAGSKPTLIEVIAARDEDKKTVNEPAYRQSKRPYPHQEEPALVCLEERLDELRTVIVGREDALSEKLAQIKEGLDTFFDFFGRQRKDGSHLLTKVYDNLIAKGISRQRSFQLVEILKRDFSSQEIGDYASCLRIVEGLITESIATAPGEGKRVKTFIGPPGVGKTTTLAKLAAHYALEQKVSVGLITTDTYRIAAAEQLKIYAQIIGIPLEIAPDRDAFRRSVRRFASKDIILVDTVGKSPRDENYLRKMKDVLTVEPPVETNLLLSLTSSQENLLDAAARYRIFDYDQIIFTKLDECTHFGFLYNVIEKFGKPVSYLTNGQNVPRDIEKATPAKLARLIVGSGLDRMRGSDGQERMVCCGT